jgi:VanZ family protein
MNPVSGSTAGWQQGISAWAPTLLWVGVIFAIGSSRALPMQDGAVLRLMIRKSIHLAEYAMLGWLIYRSTVARSGQPRCAVMVCILMTAIAIAGLDEWHQTFVPGRSGSPLDVMIDAAGAGIGLLLVLLLDKRSAQPSLVE